MPKKKGKRQKLSLVQMGDKTSKALKKEAISISLEIASNFIFRNAEICTPRNAEFALLGTQNLRTI